MTAAQPASPNSTCSVCAPFSTTLNTAAAMNGYILADRGTWLSFKNRQNLKIIVEGDSKLFNQYGVILVNPKKHPQIKG